MVLCASLWPNTLTVQQKYSCAAQVRYTPAGLKRLQLTKQPRPTAFVGVSLSRRPSKAGTTACSGPAIFGSAPAGLRLRAEPSTLLRSRIGVLYCMEPNQQTMAGKSAHFLTNFLLHWASTYPISTRSLTRSLRYGRRRNTCGVFQSYRSGSNFSYWIAVLLIDACLRVDIILILWSGRNVLHVSTSVPTNLVISQRYQLEMLAWDWHHLMSEIAMTPLSGSSIFFIFNTSSNFLCTKHASCAVPSTTSITRPIRVPFLLIWISYANRFF